MMLRRELKIIAARSAAVPCRTKSCYSSWSEEREMLGSEAARVHHAPWRRGGMAVGGSRASDKQDTSGRNYRSG
jgi:hypothetical protein